MSVVKKGLSIGITSVNESLYVELKAVGKLTHKDYELMAPMLEEAIKEVKEPKINILIDVLDSQGWELRTAWDDLKLGIKHSKEFAKIAIVGNKPWEEYAAKFAQWFLSGESRYFEQHHDAVEWIFGGG